MCGSVPFRLRVAQSGPVFLRGGDAMGRYLTRKRPLTLPGPF